MQFEDILLAAEEAADIAVSGSRLEPCDASLREKAILQTPTDINCRILLLGFYLKNRGTPENVLNRYRHISWFVENCPWHPIARHPFMWYQITDGQENYEQIRHLWLSQTFSNHPRQKEILLNAAQFFLQSEIQVAEDCLLKAQAIAPEDALVLSDIEWLRMFRR